MILDSSVGLNKDRNLDYTLNLIKDYKPKINKSKLLSKDIEAEQETVTQLFRKLNEAKEQCNYESYRILASIFDITRENRGTMKSDTPTNSLLIDVLRQHAKNCRAGYLSRFKKTFIDEEASKKVDLILGNEILDEAVAHLDKSTDALVSLQLSSVSFINSIPYIYDRLLELSKEEIEKRSKTYLKNIWNNGREDEHLIEPCRAYMKPLKDIFYPAELDMSLDSSKLEAINPMKDADFSRALTKFHICSVVVENYSFGGRLNNEHSLRLMVDPNE